MRLTVFSKENARPLSVAMAEAIHTGYAKAIDRYHLACVHTTWVEKMTFVQALRRIASGFASPSSWHRLLQLHVPTQRRNWFLLQSSSLLLD